MGTDVEGNSTDLWVADDTGKSKGFKSWRRFAPINAVALSDCFIGNVIRLSLPKAEVLDRGRQRF